MKRKTAVKAKKKGDSKIILLVRWKHLFWFWVAIDLFISSSFSSASSLHSSYSTSSHSSSSSSSSSNMTDRVHPSSKPAAAGNPAPAKPQLYNPTRPMYRPQQYNRRRRSSRNLCCCCCFWSIVVILGVALLAAIAGAALYVLYRPHRPQFSVTNLRIAKMNLTTSSDSSSHLTTLLNLTLIANNPNNHLVFFYEPFAVTAFSDSVQIGNGSLSAFTSDKNNQTSLRVVLSDSRDLDTDSLTSLRSGLKKAKGFPIQIQMDTKVKLKMEWLKSKRVGIRVICDGIKGTVPTGKTPSVSSVTDSDCKVDLRIKIWKFSF